MYVCGLNGFSVFKTLDSKRISVRLKRENYPHRRRTREQQKKTKKNKKEDKIENEKRFRYLNHKGLAPFEMDTQLVEPVTNTVY